MMKFWVVIFLLSSSHAAVILTPRNPDDFGGAVTFQNQDVLGQYDFGYNEGHPSGASFRRESGDAFGNKVGSFGLRDADGRVRVVRYVADSNGFRAEVTSNEPGVAPQDPASATINKPALVPVPQVFPVEAYPPPPPPPPPPAPIAFAPPPKAYPPPPAVYNYIAPPQVAIPRPPPPAYNYVGPIAAPLPPPPPPAYFPPRYAGPVAAPYPPPVAVAPVVAPVAPVALAPAPAKGIPPPAYYSNVVPGKEVVGVLRNYPSLAPPFASVPPQFGFLTLKSPPYYQPLGNPL